MDTERLLRIFDRMMEANGPVFIASLAAIVGLLLLVFIMRKITFTHGCHMRFRIG